MPSRLRCLFIVRKRSGNAQSPMSVIKWCTAYVYCMCNFLLRWKNQCQGRQITSSLTSADSFSHRGAGIILLWTNVALLSKAKQNRLSELITSHQASEIVQNSKDEMQNKNELAYNTFLLRFFFDSRSERCLHFKKWAFAFCIPRSLFVFLFVLYYVQAHRYQNHDSASQLRMDSAETTVDVRPKGHHLASSS